MLLFFSQLKGVINCEHVIAAFNKEKMCNLLLLKLPIVKEMVETLEIMYEATMMSEKANYSLTDFYKCWVITKLKLDALENTASKTELSAYLLKAIQKRESTLLDNKLMKCAMILDPRFCDELPGEQVFDTKQMLVGIWNAMKPFRSSQQNETNNRNDKKSSDTEIFKQYMKNKGKQRQSTMVNSTTDDEILNSIDLFIEQENIEEFPDCDSWSIITFWQDKKKTYPLLYEIAMVVFGIAPTEVTVERMFSVFAYIYSDYRTKLSQDLLEDILLIILNPDLLEQVNNEDVNHLLFTQKDP